MPLRIRDLVARLIIKTDKQAAADLDKQVTTGFEKIENAAKKAGAAIIAAFAVDRIFAFGKSLIMAAAEAEVPWNRLANTLANVGIALEDVEAQIKLAAAAMEETTKIDAEDFADILDRLISLSGDFTKSLENVPVVVDIAAKFFRGNLEPAMDLVGKALAGNARGFKALGIQTKDATAALREAADMARGAGANELNTLQGRLDEVAKAWVNLKEEAGGALLRALSGTNDNVSALESLERVIKRVTGWFSKEGALGREQLQKKTGIALWQATGGPIGRMMANLLAKDLNEIEKELQALRTADAFAGLDFSHAKPAGPVAGPARPRPMATPGAALGLAGIPGLGTVRTPATALFGLMPEEQLLRSAERFREGFREIEDAGVGAALGVTGAFEDMFGALIKDFGNLGKAAEALGRGITGALLGGIAQFASKKVVENIALAFENIAKGKAAASSLVFAPLAPGFFSAAKDNFVSAGLWGLLAGGAGAAQGAIGGGGAGSRSGGVPTGSTPGRTAENPGPQTIHISIDAFNPRNPVHARTGAELVKAGARMDSNIDIKPRR